MAVALKQKHTRAQMSQGRRCLIWLKSKFLLQRGELSNCPPILFTLNCGGWADDKRLLEGFRLAAQPSRTRWNRDTLLSESRNVDGGLLVQRRLVVEQRNRSPRRRHLLEKPKLLSAKVIVKQLREEKR